MPDRNTLLLQPDEELFRHCTMDNFRASGPGGQHRNTTDSAVRLTLPEYGVSVTAVESRSQHENRSDALRKLRLQLALQVRDPHPRGWKGPLKIGRKDRRYPLFVAILLDALSHFGFQLGDASKALGISTGRLVRILAADEELWAKVNAERQAHDLHPLRLPD